MRESCVCVVWCLGSVNVCHANEINPISNLNQISIYVEKVSFGSAITSNNNNNNAAAE